jgi:hypothetical protein
MTPHRLRRGTLLLLARRSRQNANLFLRRPSGNLSKTRQQYTIAIDCRRFFEGIQAGLSNSHGLVSEVTAINSCGNHIILKDFDF